MFLYFPIFFIFRHRKAPGQARCFPVPASWNLAGRSVAPRTEHLSHHSRGPDPTRNTFPFPFLLSFPTFFPLLPLSFLCPSLTRVSHRRQPSALAAQATMQNLNLVAGASFELLLSIQRMLQHRSHGIKPWIHLFAFVGLHFRGLPEHSCQCGGWHSRLGLCCCRPDTAASWRTRTENRFSWWEACPFLLALKLLDFRPSEIFSNQCI